MRKGIVFFSGSALLVDAMLCTAMAVPSQGSSARRDQEILEATGVRGGLVVVHLGAATECSRPPCTSTTVMESTVWTQSRAT
jgi:hypothetical protein